MENKEKQMSTSSFFSGRGSHGADLNILRKYKLNLHFFKLSPSVVSSSNRISNFEIKIISKLTQDLHHLVNIHIIFTSPVELTSQIPVSYSAVGVWVFINI